MHIKLENICLKYGDTTIFNNLNYIFTNGIYLISGKSGVGKTTLFNILTEYIKPDKGHISKEDIHISYLMQETLLFNNLTVKDNFYINFVKNQSFVENTTDIILEHMKKIGLQLNLIDKKVSLLSGGQKRKLELILLFLNDSNVFLLDEPVANLDEDSVTKVVSYIENQLSSHRIALISSHCHMDFKNRIEKLYLKDGNLLKH